MRIAWMLSIAGLAAACLPAAAQAKWQVRQTLHIGGKGGWDYVTVDQRNDRVFITRGTHTIAIDGATGRMLGDIGGQIRSHGTALVPALHRGFITDGGGAGHIVVFDTENYRVLGELATMPDSDGIIYDRGDNLVLAASGEENKLMLFRPDIDPRGGRVDSIDLGGAPEFLAADGRGRAYVNLTNKDMVAVVDLKARKVVARWPLAPGGHPAGMAIDRRDHLLFIGCRKPRKLIVMSTDDGRIVAALPIGAGNDAVRFGRGQAFASCRDGSLTVVGKRGGKWRVEQVVETREGARTMGMNRRTGTLYLPTAEFEAAGPHATARRWPRIKPGSFVVLVVRKSR